MTTQTIPLPTAPATPSTGCTLPCPRCGEANACVSLWLADTLAENAFTCSECNAEFGRADIEAIIKHWPAILRWLDAIPAAEAE